MPGTDVLSAGLHAQRFIVDPGRKAGRPAIPRQPFIGAAPNISCSLLPRYGRGSGVGRGLDVGATLGVGVGLGEEVAVAVAVGVGEVVGVGVGVPPPVGNTRT
jgi:hypothetical protein